MARRGRERFEKRQREQIRREKAEAKAERRSERTSDQPDDEDALLEEFRRLSECHDAGELSDEAFIESKREIFEQLGIASD